ncbi:MAG: ATPase/DNA packaging protein [Minisyncoccia bacterium]
MELQSDEENTDFVPDSTDQLVDRLATYFSISIIAKRNMGKTRLMSGIIKSLKAKKRVDKIVVLSGSAGLNDDYKDVINEKLILPFQETTLLNIWNLQASKKKEEREHILIILDDCLANPQALKSEMVNRLYTQSRHLQISLAVLSQYGAHLLTPLRKANSDIIMWCKLNNRGLENLWLSTSGITKEKFIDISVKYSNGNYQFMVLDNFVRSSKAEDQLTVVKAD